MSKSSSVRYPLRSRSASATTGSQSDRWNIGILDVPYNSPIEGNTTSASSLDVQTTSSSSSTTTDRGSHDASCSIEAPRKRNASAFNAGKDHGEGGGDCGGSDKANESIICSNGTLKCLDKLLRPRFLGSFHLFRLVVFASAVAVITYVGELKHLASRHALLGGPFGSDKDLVVALLPLSTPSIPTATSSPHTMDDTHASAVGSLSGAQILGSTHRYEVAARVAVFTMSLRRFSDADAIIFAEEPIDPLILAVAERAKTSQEGKYSHRVWLLPSATRTVVQSDPFGDMTRNPKAVHVFGSNQHIWDENEIRECFGQGVVSILSMPRAVILPGVFAGSVDRVLQFYSAIKDAHSASRIDTLLPSEDGANTSNISSCEYPLTDLMLQSAAALGKQVRTRLWPLGTGALIDLSESAYSVALASSLGGVFSTSQSREVRNADFDMPAIVLNYDRNPALAESLKRQYSFWNSSHISQWNFDADGQCKWYDLVPNRDMFRGRCYVTAVRLEQNSLTDCCRACANHPLCYGFTYLQRSCILRHRCDEPKLFAEYPGGTSGLVKLQYLK